MSWLSFIMIHNWRYGRMSVNIRILEWSVCVLPWIINEVTIYCGSNSWPMWALGQRSIGQVRPGSRSTVYESNKCLNYLLCFWWLIWPIQTDAKEPDKWLKPPHNIGYSSESTQWELSNEYQHDRVSMVSQCFGWK